MSLADFRPEVWTSPGLPTILVCGRKWIHDNPIQGAKIPTTYKTITHVVAIQIDPPKVFFGHTGPPDADTVWTRHKPELVGISTRCAALALAEAWKCVDPSEFDIGTLSIIHHIREDRFNGFRGGAIHRNVCLWMNWDRWDREKLSFKERLASLSKGPLKTTEKAIRRVLEEATEANR